MVEKDFCSKVPVEIPILCTCFSVKLATELSTIVESEAASVVVLFPQELVEKSIESPIIVL